MIKIPKSISKLSFLESERVVIPKLIHITYKTRKLPEVWKETPASWQNNHPDWKVMFWTDEDNRNLIRDKFPWFLEIYDKYEYGIQRADAVRYFILYTYGGLYTDADFLCKKPCDDLFYQPKDLFLIQSPNGSYITNSFMASKPKIKFWELVFENLVAFAENERPWWIGKHFRVHCSTGPVMMQWTFDKYIEEIDPSQNTIGMIPQEYIFPSCCGVCSDKPCSSVDSYTTVLEGSSWVEWDTKFFTFIYCNYVYLTILLVIFLYGFCLYLC